MVDPQLLARAHLVPTLLEVVQIFWYCLDAAEQLLGKRERHWLYQVILHDDRPETRPIRPGKAIVFLGTGRSMFGYYFEAAHEAVHCLNPKNGPATYLEEGIATDFSLRMVTNVFGQFGVDRCDVSADYADASKRAASINKDVLVLGRCLRQAFGPLNGLTIEQVRQTFQNASQDDIRRGLEVFPR